MLLHAPTRTKSDDQGERLTKDQVQLTEVRFALLVLNDGNLPRLVTGTYELLAQDADHRREQVIVPELRRDDQHSPLPQAVLTGENDRANARPRIDKTFLGQPPNRATHND